MKRYPAVHAKQMSKILLCLVLLLTSFSSAAGSVLAGPIQTIIFTVTNTNGDDSEGSLLWAIAQAGQEASSKIVFDASLAGSTITLEDSLTHWSPGDNASAEIGAKSTYSFAIVGLTGPDGKPSITINGNGNQGIYASGSGTFSMSNLIMKNFNTVDTHGGLDYMGSVISVVGEHYTRFNLDNVYFEGNNKAFKEAAGIVSVSVMESPNQVNVNRVKFVDNSLAGNSSSSNIFQGMLYFQSYVDATITNSLFANNRVSSSTTGMASGLISSGSGDYNSRWYNNTFVNNNLVNDNASGGTQAIIAYVTNFGRNVAGDARATFYNNIALGNKTNDTEQNTMESLIYREQNTPVTEEDNNLFTTSQNLFKDSPAKDYRLSPQATDAINKGDNIYATGDYDLNGNPRVDRGTVDLGAMEYTSSSNAILSSIANIEETVPSGGNGSSVQNAIKWSVDTPDSLNEIGLNDIKTQDPAAVINLYTNPNYASNEVTGNDKIDLREHQPPTYLYVKVTAENGTTVRYYEIAVNPPLTDVTLISAIADGSDSSTSTKIDLTFDQDVSVLTVDDITFMTSTASTVKDVLSGSGKHWTVTIHSVEMNPDSPPADQHPTSGDIQFILSSTGYYNFSDASPMVTLFKAKSQHALPTAAIDYTTEQLTGLEQNTTYKINNTTVTTDMNGRVDFSSEWFGQQLNIIQPGNGASADSQPQLLSIPARPSTPTNISVTDATDINASDGKLSDVNSDMEYTISDVTQWNNIQGNEVDHLPANTYLIRYKATASSFASKSVGKVISVQDPEAVQPPLVTADDVHNTIIGLDTTMEVSVDGQAYFQYNGSNLPDLSGEHTVKVRYVATQSKPAGLPALLLFTTDTVPVLTVTAIDPSGTNNNGKTLLSITSAALPGSGHKWVFKNFGTSTVIQPEIGAVVNGYNELPVSGLVDAVHGDSIVVAEIDMNGNVLRFTSLKAVVVTESSNGGSSGGSSSAGGNNNSSGSGSTPANTSVVPAPVTKKDVIVLVNGKQENAGEAITTVENNVKTTTIYVDSNKIKAKLDAEGPNAIVTIPISSDSDINQAQIDVLTVRNLQEKSASIVLQTDNASYTLPSKQIIMNGVIPVDQPSGTPNLSDFKLTMQISKVSPLVELNMEKASGARNATMLVTPYDFNVILSSPEKQVELNSFNAYVQRSILLPSTVDPSKITTGVVMRSDGSIDHIPTKITEQNGKYYATMNSMTNSVYSVVWHPITFADVNHHWAKDAVNDMGSRMVINGITDATFDPNESITRAEFAAMIIRALGLPTGAGEASFSDVMLDAWYAGAVQTAVSHKLITGFDDGTFRPQDTISREQAMTIVAKAMNLTGLAEHTDTSDLAAALASFADKDKVKNWAKDHLALTIRAKLINGRSGKIDPAATMTRAEAAALVQRLLKQSGLI